MKTTLQSFLSTHTIKCKAKNIGSEFIKSEEITRDIAIRRGYEEFDVELVTFNKVGFRRYLVVLRVVGKLVSINDEI